MKVDQKDRVKKKAKCDDILKKLGPHRSIYFSQNRYNKQKFYDKGNAQNFGIVAFHIGAGIVPFRVKYTDIFPEICRIILQDYSEPF